MTCDVRTPGMPVIGNTMRAQRRFRLRHALSLASVAVYASAFFLPTFAIVVEGERDLSYGFQAFFIGLFSPLQPFFGGGRTFLAWLANPAFWFGLVLLWTARPGRALVAGLIATGLSASFFLVGEPLDADLLFSGYYVWVLSMAMLAVASAIALVTNELERLAKQLND